VSNKIPLEFYLDVGCQKRKKKEKKEKCPRVEKERKVTWD